MHGSVFVHRIQHLVEHLRCPLDHRHVNGAKNLSDRHCRGLCRLARCGSPSRSEFHDTTASIHGIRLALDQPILVQPTQHVAETSRGQEQPRRELPGIGALISPLCKRAQHVQFAPRKSSFAQYGHDPTVEKGLKAHGMLGQGERRSASFVIHRSSVPA